MIANLLTRLEEDKDQWIYNAIDHFNAGLLGFEERYEKDQVLIGVYGPTQDEPTAVRTPEEQIMQIKNIVQSNCKQKRLELEVIELEIKMMEESMAEDLQTQENLETSVEYLQKELELYEGELRGLDQIQLEKYKCVLYTKFEFDKKDQVVFKERKISKLKESFQMVELEMLDFYQKQLSGLWLLLTRSMQNISSTTKFNFQTSPSLMALSLVHGRGIDQYIKAGNFEEDYEIVLDTLMNNNDRIYEYYVSQIDQFKRECKEEIIQLWTLKSEHKRLADEEVAVLQAKKKQNEATAIELHDRLVSAKQDWEQDLLQSKLLDELLKEEFIRVVTDWQEKLLAEESSDEERWMYHQYCQVILKQAERIIGYEYF